MKLVTLHWALLAGSFLAAGFSCPATPADGNVLPEASEVMQRVVQRAEDVARAGEADKYTFEKHIISEDLDGLGEATKTKDQEYRVIPIQGVPFSRLIKIGNQDLTEEETEAQNRRELEFRERVARKDAKPVGRRRRNWLDTRVVERFDFKVDGRESYCGRPVLILSFHPKASHAASRTVEDKVLPRLAGTLWVDAKEAEIAKLSAGLTKDLSFGLFGAVGW